MGAGVDELESCARGPIVASLEASIESLAAGSFVVGCRASETLGAANFPCCAERICESSTSSSVGVAIRDRESVRLRRSRKES